MIRTNVLVFSILFAFFVNQNAEEKIDMEQPSTDSSVIDGPYVLYRNDSVIINHIEDNAGVKSVKTDGVPSSLKNNVTLQVNTDEPGKTFTVKLKDKLTNEKAEYNSIKKMLVISDIEGNFEAFRKLLQANGVIDENFNWTYGKDHLVLVG